MDIDIDNGRSQPSHRQPLLYLLMTSCSLTDCCPQGPNTGDTAWVIVASVLVLGMMPGLALFEIGLLRAKNSVSLMLQIMGGIMVLSTLWFIVGFSFVYGETVYGFIGNPATYPLLYALRDGGCLEFAPTIPGLVFAVFQTMFATITPLLMTGSFADRMTFKSWIIFCVAWEILVYYPLAHWIWGKGWLSPFGDIITRKNEGVIDFAGGIVIHTSAGTGAFVGALILGKRRGFVEYNYGKFPMSSLPLALVGVCFLWIGWFGFNGGSALTSGTTTAIAVINTHIAACVSGAVWLFGAWIKHTPSLVETVNGAVAGLAGITPASGYIGVDAALIISLILGLASFFAVPILKEKLHVDDALDVSVVHGLTGIIGSFAIGIASSTEFNKNGMNGWIAGNPMQMAQQLLGIALAMFLGGFWTWAIMKVLEKTIGIRVSPEVEDAGLDFSEHGELAYETLHKKYDDYQQVENGRLNQSQSSRERVNIDTELDASM